MNYSLDESKSIFKINCNSKEERKIINDKLLFRKNSNLLGINKSFEINNSNNDNKSTFNNNNLTIKKINCNTKESKELSCNSQINFFDKEININSITLNKISNNLQGKLINQILY
jgi:hypothetical protein